MNPALNQAVQVGFDNYSILGDTAVITVCLTMIILLWTSYVSRTPSFRIFMTIIGQLMVAAIINITYHHLLIANNPAQYNLIYAMRVIYYFVLHDVLFLCILYTTVAAGMEHREARAFAVTASLLLVTLLVIDIVRAVTGHGYSVTMGRMTIQRTNLYTIGYLLYIFLLLAAMRRARNLLYKRVMIGFYGTMILAILVRLIQLPLGQSSLTTFTFVFPVIAMLYIMHSNPYNVTLGAVDVRSMEDYVRNMNARGESFFFVSLLLTEYNEEGVQLPEDVRAVIRRLVSDYYRGGVLFQIGNGHVLMIAPKRKNPDYEQRVERSLNAFRKQYERLRHPYKIVIGQSVEEISRKNEYASLIKNIQNRQPENTVRFVREEEIAHFNRDEYILRELADIYSRADVDDPRVLAYCQPVYNLRTGRFDTAEALMRLNLPETGIVMPDQFIHVAEEHGYIHILTEIILNKTCREIHRLVEDGFHITRISVNVSVLELKDNAFCDDINSIIDSNSISGEKVAIELTESQSEADFMIMKAKIEELRKEGIKFYLDDFGTGYSNMERIMELPFDIIKFDRSMVIASGTDDRSEKIVENLAHMFKDMEYSVLYEGVEDDADEKRCRDMCASYLQGFKYSRPVPIEQLRQFLQKAG